MGKALPYDIRRKIVEFKQAEQDNKTIAQTFGCSESVVKKIYRNYLEYGDAVFRTKYCNCGRSSQYDEAIRSGIAQIRDNRQGASWVYSQFLLRYPDLKVPSIRTIQRWWVAEGTSRPTGRTPSGEKKGGQNKRIIHGK